jgi:phenylacetic acid degradation protein
MKVYAIDGIVPVVDPTAFVHPSAVLIGDVHVGPRAYIGPCASLRGDFGRLFIGAGANVQDCCVMHGFPHSDTIIEEDGHIGHGAILHGCIVRRNGMVGMNSVVMDKAVVGESAIVAAQSFVKTGFEIPPRMLAGGSPAKLMRALTELEMNWKVEGTAVYHDLVRRCHAGLVETEPLAAAEPGRKRLQLPELKTLPETRRAKS